MPTTTTRFFKSIPEAVKVEGPYDEVFSLFTTETSDTPWAHNRSVSQQSTQLEVELDFTPAPSPTVSRPSSRPESRAGSEYGIMDGGSVSMSTITPGSGQGIGTMTTSTTPIPTVGGVSPAASRTLMGNSRKSSLRRLVSDSGGVKVVKPQPKKPVVIHQSLSTLSQPGQTGTVVWDSSILMAKFMLSIQGLSRRYYRERCDGHTVVRGTVRQEGKDNQKEMEGEGEGTESMMVIRRLEKQAENLAIAEDGNLRRIDSHDEEEEDLAGDHRSESESELEDEEDEDDQEERLVFDPAETSILELGSGCGLLGIVLAEFCKDLLLTDQKPVLPLLVKNLRKNLDKKYFDHDTSSSFPTSQSLLSLTTTPSTSSGSAGRKKNKAGGADSNISETLGAIRPCHIQVQELVWGEPLEQDLKRGLGLDYVIATDVVYNESIVPKLVQTLKDLCQIRQKVLGEINSGHGDAYEDLLAARSGSSTGHRSNRPVLDRTVILLAQELRTDYVHLAFLDRLDQAGFRMIRMPKQMMDADYQSGYAIYAIYLK